MGAKATRARGYVKITGMPEMLQKMQGLGQFAALEKISYRATIGAAKDLMQQVYVNAALALEPPPDSGALLRAIAVKKIQRNGKRGYTVGFRAGRNRVKKKKSHFMGPMPADAPSRDVEDAFYWWFLEFGTKHQHPRAFFRNAIAEHMPGTATKTIQGAGTKAVLDSANRLLKKIGNGKGKA